MSVLPARLIAALALVAGAVVLLAPRPAAIAGGLLLAFVLPGLALIGLLRRRTLTPVETAVLTPALSMGVVIGAGLLSSVLGVRIDRAAWTVSTVGVTLVALVAARLLPRRTPAAYGSAPRTRAQPETPAKVPDDEPTVALPSGAMAEANTVVMSIVPVPAEDEQQVAAQDQARRRRLLRQFLPLVLVAAVLGGASWLSFQTSRDTHDTVVTALSAAPSGPVDAAGNRTVQLFATGLLAADGPYTLSIAGPAGTATLRRSVPVPPDGTWYESLSLPGTPRLTVSLYRAGDTTAYRTLYLSAVD